MTAFKAAILAGGSGERFWPLSTPERPKQFLRIFGKESLLRQTASRLAALAGSDNIFVVTAKALVRQTRRELPELARERVAGEPCRRDTAAAVALGVGIAADNDDTIVGFFPSDHLAGDAVKFRSTVRKAVSIARKHDGIIVVGIKPAWPSTAYGYVEPGTGRFVEKPDAAKAREYIRKGFLWNAGMFIAKAGVFRAAIAEYAAPLLALAEAKIRSPAKLARIYEDLPRIPFDKAVMEKLSGGPRRRIEVVPGDFGWDDVGDYLAFERHFKPDTDGNLSTGTTAAIDSSGNICAADGVKIALLGVKGLVVAATPSGVLVADKRSLGGMKRLPF